MIKEISLDPYDPASYDAAIKEIKAYKKWAKKKVNELCRRLAEIGIRVAQVYFVPGAWNGGDDVSLSVEQVRNGFILKASGESVCFMEFGAGMTAGLGYDTSDITPPVPIEPKSWSKTNGTGEFDKYGSWHYKKVKYDSIVPQMGMYHAVKEIKQRVEEIAQEVFSS